MPWQLLSWARMIFGRDFESGWVQILSCAEKRNGRISEYENRIPEAEPIQNNFLDSIHNCYGIRILLER